VPRDIFWRFLPVGWIALGRGWWRVGLITFYDNFLGSWRWLTWGNYSEGGDCFDCEGCLTINKFWRVRIKILPFDRRPKNILLASIHLNTL
jgi:hypothetical protein